MGAGMRATALAVGLLVGWSGGASAAALDNTTLFERDAWSVEHTYEPGSGDAWCSADTTNDAGQWFSLVAYDFGAVALFVGDPQWSLAERGVRIRVDVDDDRWDLDGTGDGAVVAALLNGDDDDAVRFVARLREGVATAVFNDEGRRLATFSLQGSGAALTALFECWSRIDATDPFVTASDPF